MRFSPPKEATKAPFPKRHAQKKIEYSGKTNLILIMQTTSPIATTGEKTTLSFILALVKFLKMSPEHFQNYHTLAAKAISNDFKKYLKK